MQRCGVGESRHFLFSSNFFPISPQTRDSLCLGLALVTQGLTMSRGEISHFPPKTKHKLALAKFKTRIFFREHCFSAFIPERDTRMNGSITDD